MQAIRMKETSAAVLEHVDGFITVQARKLMHGSHQPGGQVALDTLEVDELIQRARIKLWKMLEKGSVLQPFSYAKRIVYSEFIDMKRQQKPQVPLPENEDEGSYPLKYLGTDPADEVIQRMETSALLQQLIQMIRDLPARQQTAMLSFLWDQIEDTEGLRALLMAYGLNGKVVAWPQDKDEKRKLQASLSVARQKMLQKRYA